MSEQAANRSLPTARQRRIQAALDSGAALAIAMLAWPFPLARALLPLPVNVVSVVVFWQLVQIGYCTVTAGVWGLTGGMRLQGLILETQAGEEPVRDQRLRWGAVAGLLLLVRLASPGATGRIAEERISGLRLYIG